MDDVVAVVALTLAAVLLWATSFGRVAWLVVGGVAGAGLHAQYHKYRVQVRLLQWKVRCRVKHWWAGLTEPARPVPPRRGPRHIPKPTLDPAPEPAPPPPSAGPTSGGAVMA